jgi:hypothetical protein
MIPAASDARIGDQVTSANTDIATAQAEGLTGWQLEAVQSLFLYLIVLQHDEDEGTTWYVNGQHSNTHSTDDTLTCLHAASLWPDHRRSRPNPPVFRRILRRPRSS